MQEYWWYARGRLVKVRQVGIKEEEEEEVAGDASRPADDMLLPLYTRQNAGRNKMRLSKFPVPSSTRSRSSMCVSVRIYVFSTVLWVVEGRCEKTGS